MNAVTEGGALFLDFALSLVVPAIVFFLFAVLVKGKELFFFDKVMISEMVLNVKIYLLDFVFLGPVIVACFSFFIPRADGFDFFSGAEFWQGVNPFFMLFACIFLGDFVGYWRHRIEHSYLLWPFHAVHHSDERMTWLTLFRFHPVNRVTTLFMDTSLLLLMGFPFWVVMSNNLFRHYYGMWVHADVPWRYSFLSTIFVSPVMHRWHHVKSGRGCYSNYATVFSIFDRVFGTYYVPGVCDSPLGVDRKWRKTLHSQLVEPLVDFKRKAWSLISHYKSNRTTPSP